MLLFGAVVPILLNPVLIVDVPGTAGVPTPPCCLGLGITVS